MSKEKHFTPSRSFIECTGCPCGVSNLLSTTATVYVKKQPMATIKDGVPTSFTPFPSCTLSTTGTCVPAPMGTWETQSELKKIDIEKQTPIIEGNRIKCQAQLGVGTITISEKSDTPPPPENIVDKAQNKINKAANAVTKQITEITKDASDAITGIAGAAKDAGGFLQNKSVQGAIANTSDLVDDIDEKKAGLDVTVGNINIRLENLRKELAELITGERQELAKLMEIRPKEESTEVEQNSEEEDEMAYNQDFFDQTNQESVNAFLNNANDDIDALKKSEEAGKTPRDFEIKPQLQETQEGEEKKEMPAPRYWTESDKDHKKRQDALEAQKNNTIPIPKNRLDQIQDNWKTEKDTAIKGTEGYYETANNVLEEHKVTLGSNDDKKDQLKAIAVLENLPGLLQSGEKRSQLKNRILEKPKFEDPFIINEQPRQYSSEELNNLITEHRGELNTEVQAEIDGLLEEIGYTENLQKYQKESAELQEDIDRSAAALDVLGDFGAFVDGIAAKHLGRLTAKYKGTVDQMGKNMARLNDSLKGSSYMAGGFKAGDVITHAPDLEKEKEKEEEKEETTILPPPVVIKDPPPPDKEEETDEETPEETDECTFTKLTVIKNNTLEYVVVEKKDDKLFNNKGQELNTFNSKHPILILNYIASDKINNGKKFTIKITGLHRDVNHKKEFLEYEIDQVPKTIKFNDGDPIMEIDIIHNKTLLEAQKLYALNFMGLGEIDHTLYNIGIPICDFTASTGIRVYPEAEWNFVLSASIDTPIASSFFNYFDNDLYKGQLQKSDELFATRTISLGAKSGKLKGTLKGGYFGKFGDESIKFEFSKNIERTFNAIAFIYKVANKINDLADSMVFETAEKSNAKAFSVQIVPPTISASLSTKLEVPKKDIFSKLNKNVDFKITADPFLATVIFIDLIKTARKFKLIGVILSVLEWLTRGDVDNLITLTVGLKFNTYAKIEFDTLTNVKGGFGFKPSLDITLRLDIKGESFGIEYEAGIKGEAAGSFDASIFLVNEDSGLYVDYGLMFNGVTFNIGFHAKATGEISVLFLDDIQIEKEYNKEFINETLFAWDESQRVGDKKQLIEYSQYTTGGGF